jgi:hypothetical protein
MADTLLAENTRLRQERDKLKTDNERLTRRLAARYEETVQLRDENARLRQQIAVLLDAAKESTDAADRS